jgi:hypothetical protein
MIRKRPVPHLDRGVDAGFPSLTNAKRLRGDHAQNELKRNGDST